MGSSCDLVSSLLSEPRNNEDGISSNFHQDITVSHSFHQLGKNSCQSTLLFSFFCDLWSLNQPPNFFLLPKQFSPVIENQLLFIATSLQKYYSSHLKKKKQQSTISVLRPIQERVVGCLLYSTDTPLGPASLGYLASSLKLSPHGISSLEPQRGLCVSHHVRGKMADLAPGSGFSSDTNILVPFSQFSLSQELGEKHFCLL